MSPTARESFQLLSWLMVLLGVASSFFIAVDLRRRQPQPMAVMRLVWPIWALGAVVSDCSGRKILLDDRI